MKFRIDNAGYGWTYIDVKDAVGKVELGVGIYDSSRRSSVTPLNHEQALALAGALQAVAWELRGRKGGQA